VYGVNPLTPLDLIPIPSESRVSFEAETRAKEMRRLHDQIKNQIEKTNEAYKARANKHRKPLEFQPGDLVWLHFRKERFPSRRKNKLMARSDVPFEVLEKVGSNAYKLQLLGDMAVSATFKIGDLSPYVEDNFEDPSDLRPNPSEEGEVEAGALAKEAQGNLGDGEPSMEPCQGPLDSPRSSSSGAKIKEKVLALLTQATVPPGYTSMPQPGFVHLIANDPEGVSA